MSSIEEIIEKLKLNYKKLFDNYTDKFDKFEYRRHNITRGFNR
jgi:hypothetical protein